MNINKKSVTHHYLEQKSSSHSTKSQKWKHKEFRINNTAPHNIQRDTKTDDNISITNSPVLDLCEHVMCFSFNKKADRRR